MLFSASLVTLYRTSHEKQEADERYKHFILSDNKTCLHVLTVITSNCMMEMGLRFLPVMDGIPRPPTKAYSKCLLKNPKILPFKPLWLTPGAMSKLITACRRNH